MQEINRRYIGKPEYARIKSGEICPTDTVPVITLQDKKPQACLFTWGFPRWKGTGVIINARSETIFDKSMFRQAFTKRRCIIPSTGFYEWQKERSKRGKNKYLLQLPNTPMLYMAGLYTVYEKDGICLPGFVIITTAANSSVEPIHDRMPVIMKKHEQELWLHDDIFAREIIKREGPQVNALCINESSCLKLF